MPREIKPIRLPLPLNMGAVNSYLVRTGRGCVLIDTGGSNQRAALAKELAGAGCWPGRLDLIVITHGDFDHIGNAAYLRQKFGAKIAMHRDDAGMAERGDMSWNRKKGGLVLRTLVPLFFRFAQADRFSPDLYLEDGDDLSSHGFDTRVLHLPGHSRGSIGVLAGDGLFCGDLLDNTKRPALNALIDNMAAAQASVERLTALEIDTVYPGHGEPFPLEALESALRGIG